MLRTMPSSVRAISAVALCSVAACKSPEAKLCIAEFEAAQAVVLEVKSNDVDSVSGSVTAVQGAIARCKEADRSLEVAELEKAERMLSQHLTRLREHLARPKEVPLTPEQVAERVKAGDPSCPRGQGYLHKASGKHIRCTGALPVDMSFGDAQRYYEGRGYKLVPQTSPRSLTVEFGAEKQIFRYGAAGDADPPQCVVSYPAPGVSWQEATARLTGVPPSQLIPGKTVPSRQGKLMLNVDEGPNHLIVKLGECG
jgi:hypothetical protein